MTSTLALTFQRKNGILTLIGTKFSPGNTNIVLETKLDAETPQSFELPDATTLKNSSVWSLPSSKGPLSIALLFLKFKRMRLDPQIQRVSSLGIMVGPTGSSASTAFHAISNGVKSTWLACMFGAVGTRTGIDALLRRHERGKNRGDKLYIINIIPNSISSDNIFLIINGSPLLDIEELFAVEEEIEKRWARVPLQQNQRPRETKHKIINAEIASNEEHPILDEWNISDSKTNKPISHSSSEILDLITSEDYKHFLIEGEAGNGKSTLVANLAKIGSDRGLDIRLIRLKSFQETGDLIHTLDEILRNKKGKPSLLILDGLEDLYYSQSNMSFHEIARCVDDVLQIVFKIKIICVVTSRIEFSADIVDYGILNGFLRIRLYRWTWNQTLKYIDNDSNMWNELPKEIRSLLGLPLYSYLFKHIISQGTLQKNVFSGVRKEVFLELNLLDIFIEQEIRTCSLKTGRLKRDLRVLVEEIAWQIRKRSSVSITETIMIEVSQCLPMIDTESLTLPLIVSGAAGRQFRHELIVEALIAQRIARLLSFARAKEALDQFVTSYKEDLFTAMLIMNDQNSTKEIEKLLISDDSDIAGVNGTGILAKVPGYKGTEVIWAALANNSGLRARYERAVKNRLASGSSGLLGAERIDWKNIALDSIVNELTNGIDPVAAYFCIENATDLGLPEHILVDTKRKWNIN